MKSRKLIILLIFLTLVLGINQFLIYNHYQGVFSPALIPVLGNLNTKLIPLQEQQIKEYRQVQGTTKEKLEQEMARITMHNLGLEHWQEFSDLKIIIKEGNVYPSSGSEIFIALSTGKDNGVIGVYAKGKNNNYDLVDKMSNLVPITDLSFLTLPGRTLKGLIIQEYLDERFGAFFESSTITIYAWQKTLHKVWEGSKFYEAVWNEEWEGKKPRWLKITESNRIRLLKPGQLQTVKETEFWQAIDNPGPPPPESYTLIKKETVTELLEWDGENFKFTLKKKEP